MIEIGGNITIVDRGQYIKAEFSSETELAYKFTRVDEPRYTWLAKSQIDPIFTYSPMLGHNVQLPRFIKPVWKEVKPS